MLHTLHIHWHTYCYIHDITYYYIMLYIVYIYMLLYIYIFVTLSLIRLFDYVMIYAADIFIFSLYFSLRLRYAIILVIIIDTVIIMPYMPPLRCWCRHDIFFCWWCYCWLRHLRHADYYYWYIIIRHYKSCYAIDILYTMLITYIIIWYAIMPHLHITLRHAGLPAAIITATPLYYWHYHYIHTLHATYIVIIITVTLADIAMYFTLIYASFAATLRWHYCHITWHWVITSLLPLRLSLYYAFRLYFLHDYAFDITPLLAIDSCHTPLFTLLLLRDVIIDRYIRIWHKHNGRHVAAFTLGWYFFSSLFGAYAC